MSTMPETKRKRSRRSFSEEFKAGAVRLVLEEGKTVGAAARDLDLTESSLRKWVERVSVLSENDPRSDSRDGQRRSTIRPRRTPRVAHSLRPR